MPLVLDPESSETASVAAAIAFAGAPLVSRTGRVQRNCCPASATRRPRRYHCHRRPARCLQPHYLRRCRTRSLSQLSPWPPQQCAGNERNSLQTCTPPPAEVAPDHQLASPQIPLARKDLDLLLGQFKPCREPPPNLPIRASASAPSHPISIGRSTICPSHSQYPSALALLRTTFHISTFHTCGGGGRDSARGVYIGVYIQPCPQCHHCSQAALTCAASVHLSPSADAAHASKSNSVA